MTRALSFVPVLLLCFSLGCSGGRGPSSKDPGTVDNSDNNLGADIELRINEVCASGTPDWIELVNLGTEVAVLDGFTVSDDKTKPTKGKLAAGQSVHPGDHFVVEISDTTVGFKLAADEEVHLYDTSGAVVDEVDWNAGDSPAGGSYARLPDGTGAFQPVNVATEGAPNG